MNSIYHPRYLPFSEEQFLSHFADVNIDGECIKNKKHLEYYKKSVERYNRYNQFENNPNRKKSLEEMKLPCQIEKDERFWTASCLMTIFYSENRNQELFQLFTDAYGYKPPIKDLNSWNECFGEELRLFFEPSLPSPKLYKKWLFKNLKGRHFVPYILESAEGKEDLEGATKVDAMFLNPENGFAVVIESKVLSDISYDITYDTMRNQIIRIIDVMLENNESLCYPLNKRNPNKTLFLLVTPKLFKDNPSSRLYGYKFNEYRNNPGSLARDLPHRANCDWQNLSDRMGWLTWEDFKDVNKNCCPWLE